MKPHLGKIQGGAHPHQTTGNVGNGNHSTSISASSRYRKGGCGKISTVDSTLANTGLFLPSFFVLFFDKDSTYLFPTNPQWCRPPAHGTAVDTPPPPMPTQDCHWENKHPIWPECRAGAGHPGGGTRGFQRDASYQDKDTVICPIT